MTYSPFKVSDITTPARLHQHQSYEGVAYPLGEFAAFKSAVVAALGGDVRFHNVDYASALVYRPGDIYTLGEIGYKDVRVKPKATHQATTAKWYIRARGIENQTYRPHLWQRSMVVSNTLKRAVKEAVERFIHPDPGYIARQSTDAAQKVVRKEVSATHEVCRAVFRVLTGDTGYGSQFNGVLWEALRGASLVDTRVNTLLTEFYKAYDTWKDATAQADKPFLFVALRDHDGVVMADTVRSYMHNAVGSADSAEPRNTRASELPETVRGRIAVLQMTAPETYVQGVGLRLDDRLFFVVEDEVE